MFDSFTSLSARCRTGAAPRLGTGLAALPNGGPKVAASGSAPATKSFQPCLGVSWAGDQRWWNLGSKNGRMAEIYDSFRDLDLFDL